MTGRSNEDEILEALRDVRPRLTEEDESAHGRKASDLRLTIVGKGWEPRARKAFTLTRAGAAALVGAAAVSIGLGVGGGSSQDPATQTLRAPDIELLAAESREAFSTTGRAVAKFVLADGLDQEQRGEVRAIFAGNDLDLTLDFETGGFGSPGFQARNRTVDGQFYLLDGPPGDRRWYHDTNASGSRAQDLYNLDPRTLLQLLDESSDFETVGTEQRGGEEVRHLRATRLQDVPPLNLGFGDNADAGATSLELWVGPDDVVRSLAVSFEATETAPDRRMIRVKPRDGDPKRVTMRGRWMIIQLPDGTRVKRPVGDVTKPSEGGTTTTYRSRYSVEFFDLGAPIEIEAPPDPIEVAGKG